MSEPTKISDGARVFISETDKAMIKNWAKHDALWTTQETVEFNLTSFARAIISYSTATEKLTEENRKLKEQNKFQQARIKILAAHTTRVPSQKELDDAIHELNLVEEESGYYRDGEILSLQSQVQGLREALNSLYDGCTCSHITGNRPEHLDTCTISIKKKFLSSTTDFSKMFVPKAEVEKAFREGFCATIDLGADVDKEWLQSNARKVVEGL